MNISKEGLKRIIQAAWEQGISDFDDIDRNWDPSDRQEGIKETWSEDGEDIVQDILKEFGLADHWEEEES